MTYCECCKNFEQQYFEDRGECLVSGKAVGAESAACDDFKPLEGQMKLEV